MSHNDIYSIGFHNQKANLGVDRLYYVLPSKIHYPYLPYAISSIICYIYLYARVMFLYTHIFHQTLSMLFQQSRLKILPCHASTFNRNYYHDASQAICQYFCGRIGAWGNGKRYASDVLLGKNFTYGVGGGWCL